MQRNKEVRQAIVAAGIHYWEVADELGIADSMFSRKLRYELSDDEKTRVYTIIEKLKKEAGE